MRSAIAVVFAMWWLYPFTAGACGLSGPWHLSSDDGYTGIFMVEKVIDDLTCDARLSVFSPVGDSAVEACRVLRSDKVVIYCEIISANSFFASPDNFILEDHLILRAFMRLVGLFREILLTGGCLRVLQLRLHEPQRRSSIAWNWSLLRDLQGLRLREAGRAAGVPSASLAGKGRSRSPCA